MRLNLSFLGKFEVKLNNKPITRFRSNNIQGLLVYLATQAGRPFSRDALATLLWPEESTKGARTNFRQILYQLRKTIEDKKADEPFLITTNKTVSFNPKSSYTLDVEQFLQALAQGDQDTAVDLFQGDLIPDFTCDSLEFEEWLRIERERLHHLGLETLAELAEQKLDAKEYDQAQILARRQLALEPWLESAFRQLMQACALDGDRTKALQEYQNCQQVLEEELGLEPSAETQQLAEHIRENRFDANDPNLLDGRYTIGEELGRGAMGQVLRGRDTHTGQIVAIKTILTDGAARREKLLRRLQQEGDLLKRLNHPNIVRYLTTTTQNDTHYLVMEYLSGGDLRQMLNSKQRMSLTEVLTIALDLADALARTHRLNILHRDIKPSNILLDDNNIPKLSDFGLARVYSETDLSRDGAITGTVAYLSPEACAGKTLDQRSDIWSFGVLLYELLTGERPFAGDAIAPMIWSIVNDPTPNLAELRPDIPVTLCNLLYSMLEKEPAERISSIRYVGGILETLLQGDVDKNWRPRFPLTQPLSSVDIGTKTVFSSDYNVTQTYHETLLDIRLAATAGPLDTLTVQTPFIGRTAEKGVITKTLDKPSCRLLTIVGSAGVGKTRLTREVAQSYMEQTGCQAYFTSLTGIDSTRQLIQSLKQALDTQSDHTQAPDIQLRPIDQIVARLAEKPHLLVLDHIDNCLQEDGRQLAVLLNTLAKQVPHLRIIVTSRTPLRFQYESVYRLRHMATPTAKTSLKVALQYDAIALFQQRAQQANITFTLTTHNISQAITLCQEVDGTPLFIELAAAQMGKRSITNLLQEKTSLFTSLRVVWSALPPYQRNAVALFEQVWQQLSPVEQTTLSNTAVFQGGFSRAAFAALGQENDVLESLLAKSLLARHELEDGHIRVRYTMPNLLQNYLRSNKPAAQELYQQHADYYLTWATKHPTQRIHEQENIAHAWQWAQTQTTYTPPKAWDPTSLDTSIPLEPEERGTPSSRSTPALIGREAELATLREGTHPSVNGQLQGSLISIIAHAGIGKSHLVANLRMEMADCTWFECPCDETSAQGLLPFRHWLKSYFGQHLAASRAENLAIFTTRFEDVVQATAEKSLAAELRQYHSLYAALVDLTLPDSLYTRLKPEQRGESFQLALKALLKAESQLQPVILHIEDAHWIDEDSRTLIDGLLRQAKDSPLTIIMTARPDSFEPWAVTELAHRTLHLKPFGKKEVIDLATHFLAMPPHKKLVALLLEKGEGNPFYTEQLLRYLRENQLVKNGKLTHSAVANPNAILPPTVQNVLVSRLGRLDEAVRAVVEQAAVLGHEFSLPVLRHAVDGDGLADALQAGTEAAVWQPLGRDRYLFNHALLRETAVSTQFSTHKQELHKRAAQAVSKTATTERPQSATLAHHYDKAGEHGRAVNYYLKAGDEARENYFVREAHGYYSRGLELATKDKQKLSLLLGREAVNHWLGNRDEQKEDLRQLVGLSTEISDTALLADIALRYGVFGLSTGDFDSATRYAQQATSIAVSMDNRMMEAKAMHIWGRAVWQKGQPNAAEPLLKRALRLAEIADNIEAQALSLYDLSIIISYREEYEESRTQLKKAKLLFENLNDKRNIARCINMLGLVAHMNGEYELALSYLYHSVEQCRVLDWIWGEAFMLGQVANCYFDLGYYERSRKICFQALTINQRIGSRQGEWLNLDTIGLSYYFEGDLRQAQSIFEQASVLSTALNQTQDMAYQRTHWGLTLANLEEIEKASILLYEAMSFWDATNDRSASIDTLAALAWLDQIRGDLPFAVERVESILAYIKQNGISGIELPLHVYWQCYVILKTAGEQIEADSLLGEAVALLSGRAQRISDKALRSQYLSKPYHRELMRDWTSRIS